ncbi:hypothetical protein BpHYR1_007699 [Brachionus plicatilis]|uniref:Uncharacterized protein n=1 Tax=Brachionus plicatilis TaxID=10195 RepID=A0A3M7P9I6_BRAPC|nr:hypothetical protein BpHYR1_007699 [Brachionus plicatilis]
MNRKSKAKNENESCVELKLLQIKNKSKLRRKLVCRYVLIRNPFHILSPDRQPINLFQLYVRFVNKKNFISQIGKLWNKN